MLFFSNYVLIVIGSSTNDLFSAIHFDLRLYSATDHCTEITLCLKEYEWDHYAKVIKVGSIPLSQLNQFHGLKRFLREMEHNILVNVYDKLCSQNGGDQ